MTNEEKLALLEDIMDIDEGELKMDTILENLDEWDSMSKLSLVASAKKADGEDITVDDIKRFVTVQDICNIL